MRARRSRCGGEPPQLINQARKFISCLVKKSILFTGWVRSGAGGAPWACPGAGTSDGPRAPASSARAGPSIGPRAPVPCRGDVGLCGMRPSVRRDVRHAAGPSGSGRMCCAASGAPEPAPGVSIPTGPGCAPRARRNAANGRSAAAGWGSARTRLQCSGSQASREPSLRSRRKNGRGACSLEPAAASKREGAPPGRPKKGGTAGRPRRPDAGIPSLRSVGGVNSEEER